MNLNLNFDILEYSFCSSDIDAFATSNLKGKPCEIYDCKEF